MQATLQDVGIDTSTDMTRFPFPHHSEYKAHPKK